MASLSRQPGGRWTVQFVGADGRRRSIRLGKCDKRTAEAARVKIEALAAAKLAGHPPADEVIRWVGSLSDTMRDRLARAGLVPRDQQVTVGQYVTQWLAEKRALGLRDSTLTSASVDLGDVVQAFGNRPLDSITPAEAQRVREAMQARGLRPATVARRLNRTRQLFGDAVRAGLIERNPFEHVRTRGGNPAERRAYVPVADALRLIEHAPNVWWRLLVALSRFAGLRVPSEALSLRWEDVDWADGRLVVRSPKTDAHGKPWRVVPLFPLLRPHFEQAFEAAEEGAEYVFPEEYRRRAQGPASWIGCNLRTTLQKIIRRAGLEPWPRLWHSLRASCESDLAQAFPLATVAKWLGNTPSIALRHYVDPTDEAFERAKTWTFSRDQKAVQKAVQQTAEWGGNVMNASPVAIEKPLDFPQVASGCDLVQNPQATPTGFEPVLQA